MTNSQIKALDKIEKLVKKDFYSENYEIKEWKVEDCDNFVSLIVSYGIIGDEGTYAAIFGRDTAHLFIGKRGAITYPAYKKNGKYVRRKFKGYSILQAVCDQDYNFRFK